MFYTTLYVGDLYKASNPIPTDDEAAAALEQHATILGSRAFFHYSLVALSANFLLPLFVRGEGDNSTPPLAGKGRGILERLKIVHLCDLWTASHFLFAVCMGATLWVCRLKT